jgi:UDP-hydrolysing UDP-N-acetyl-D-glucosamine 2-epimerase
MRTISVVTTSRADFWICLPVLKRIRAEPGLELRLFAAGMHLAADFGRTVTQIEEEGIQVSERIECLVASDTPLGTAQSLSRAVAGFAEVYSRVRSDILVVLGDRYEMYAAGLAALPFKIPVAHLHGGELAQGAIDDALRHSLTKLSHLHFASMDDYARRIRQMGEEPWRVTVCGAPALDQLATFKPMPDDELSARIGMPLTPAPLLVTFHPATLEYEQADAQANELLAALGQTGAPVVFTMPNADAGGRAIAEKIRERVSRGGNWRIADNLGTRAYFSLMSRAGAMVGNSSSGIIEAASFRLPVVNVGSRQDGRARPRNVIDAPCERQAVYGAIQRAISPAFRDSLRDLVNPHDKGGAADIIVRRLKEVPLDDRLLKKRFYDLPQSPEERGTVSTSTT